MINVIGDIHVAPKINCDAVRGPKTSGARAFATPFPKVASGGIKNLYLMILYLHHIQIAARIHGHIKGVIHLVGLKTITSETGQQIPRRAEFLDRMRSVLDHVDIVVFISRDTDWMIKMLTAGPETAPLRQKAAVAAELLNQMIVIVDNINIAFAVGRHIKRQTKLAVA